MSSQTYTKTFLFDIFPSLAAALPNEVLDIIFPVQTQELCPTPTLLLSSIPIRWPNLLLLCPIGALIGFLCSRPLSKTSPLYSSSFFFFGVMNTTAFLTHCYFPQHTKAWEVTYALDMVATSTASFYLMLAVWVESMGRENPCPSLFVKYYFCNAFVLQYLEIQHAGTGWWIAEILYIGVTGAAAIVGIVGLVCRTKVFSYEMLCLGVMLSGVGLFAAGPVLDVLLCNVFGNPWGNLLTLAFGGCDIAYFGLFLFVRAEEKRKGRAVVKKKKA